MGGNQIEQLFCFFLKIVQDIKSCSVACVKERDCCTFEWSEEQQKFVHNFLQNMRKKSRLDVSGATSTTIAEPFLRIIKTSSSVEEMVGF